MHGREEVKHTPGPLSVEMVGANGQAVVRSNWLRCGPEVEFGDVYVEFSGFFGNYGPHMFAAAPDMLAALKECALEIAQIRNRKLTSSEQAALDNARLVIARAEGNR